jgi:hypothetical protein
LAFAAVASLLLPALASACAVFMSPAERIAMGYRYNGGIYNAVAIVRVDRARYAGAAAGDTHPWTAIASILRTVKGKFKSTILSFNGGQGSSACETRQPIVPSVGEKWALYIRKRPDGAQLVHQSYPLDIALKADPRLREKCKP